MLNKDFKKITTAILSGKFNFYYIYNRISRLVFDDFLNDNIIIYLNDSDRLYIMGNNCKMIGKINLNKKIKLILNSKLNEFKIISIKIDNMFISPIYFEKMIYSEYNDEYNDIFNDNDEDLNYNEKLDMLLDKINKHGISSLSDKELNYLDMISKNI